MLKHLHRIIILGCIWGIIEATVGYFLHMFAMGIGWLLWFPIAFFFIHKSYRWTKSFSAVMMTALLASSLKLINLFFPVRLDMVFNPAASIVLEALSVVCVYHFVLRRKTNGINVFHLFLIGFTWRTLYLSYVLLLPQPFVEISPAATMLSFAKFMFLENVANTLLISAGFFVAAKLKVFHLNRLYHQLDLITDHKRYLKPALSVLSLALAIFVKLITV